MSERITADQEGVSNILLEIAQQYSPMQGIKEYVSNSIDGIFDAGGHGAVRVHLYPSMHRMIIQDDGFGIERNLFFELPKKVGTSRKIGQSDRRGEKGLGLLSFASAGHQMHIITRKSVAEPYNALIYYIKNHLVFDHVKINENKDMYSLGGPFRRGTQVVLDIDRDIFNQKFRSEIVRRELQEIYWPLIEKGNIKFFVGIEKNNEISETQIHAPRVRGEELIFESISFMSKKKGEPTQCSLHAHLWLDAQSSTPGKVSVYSKGVRVYKSILELDEEVLNSLPLWNCRQVEGYIEEPDLRLTLGRERINTQRESNVYKDMISTLKSLNDRLWPIVQEKLKSSRVSQENAFIQDIHKVLYSSWRDLDIIYKKKKKEEIVPRIPWGIERKPEEPGEGKKREDEGNDDIQKFPFGQPHLSTFPIGEKKHRSKLVMEFGKQCVHINEEHEDYKTVKNAPKSFEAAEYIVRVMSFPMAAWEVNRAQEKSGGILYSGQSDLIAEIGKRADDLAFSALRSLRERKLIK